MPRVETYGQPRVEERPIAATKITAVPGPDVFGAGLGDVAAQIGTRGFGAIEDQARERADSAALLNVDSQTGAWIMQHVHDPQTGVINTVKGPDALGLAADLGEQYDQFTSGLVAKLNPRQRDAAQKLILGRRQTMTATLDDYGSREFNGYEKAVTADALKQSSTLAVANADKPAIVAQELQKQASIVDTFAQNTHLPPELKAGMLAQTLSDTHVGVIDQLLATDKDQAAQVYFDVTKDQITGDDLTKVQRALEEGSLRGQSQRFVDGLPSTLSETDALEQAKTIADPKLRDEVENRIEHDYSLRKQAQHDDLEQAMTAAGNLIDKNPRLGVRAIPPAMWSRFSPAEKSSIELYAKRNLSPDGDGGESQAQTLLWYRLKMQSSDDPEKFAALVLPKYMGQLSKSQFKELADTQAAIRKGDRVGADKLLDDFRSQNEVVTNTLRTAGIDQEAAGVTTEQKNAARDMTARVVNMVGQRVAALERNTGKKATNADVQSITDDVLTQQVTTPNTGWWYRNFGLGLPVSSKRAVDITVNDIPATDRQQITDALKRVGRPVSDEAIVQTYIATQQRLGRGK